MAPPPKEPEIIDLTEPEDVIELDSDGEVVQADGSLPNDASQADGTAKAKKKRKKKKRKAARTSAGTAGNASALRGSSGSGTATGGASQSTGTASGNSSGARSFASPVSAVGVACLSVLAAAFALS